MGGISEDQQYVNLELIFLISFLVEGWTGGPKRLWFKLCILKKKTFEYFGYMILYISSISVAYSVTNLCSLLDLC